jgi:competence protein ComEC
MEGAAGIWKSFSVKNLALISLGMLWLMIWQTSWRLLGFVPILLGFFFAIQTPIFDIVIKENGKLWAVNLEGKLHITNRRKTFASEQWYKSIGQTDFLPLPRQDVYMVAGKTVSFNCQDADLIFDLVMPRGKNKAEAKPCEKPVFLSIDELKKNGTHTIYIGDKALGGNIRTENVKQFTGDRLWTR